MIGARCFSTTWRPTRRSAPTSRLCGSAAATRRGLPVVLDIDSTWWRCTLRTRRARRRISRRGSGSIRCLRHRRRAAVDHAAARQANNIADHIDVLDAPVSTAPSAGTAPRSGSGFCAHSVLAGCFTPRSAAEALKAASALMGLQPTARPRVLHRRRRRPRRARRPHASPRTNREHHRRAQRLRPQTHALQHPHGLGRSGLPKPLSPPGGTRLDELPLAATPRTHPARPHTQTRATKQPQQDAQPQHAPPTQPNQQTRWPLTNSRAAGHRGQSQPSWWRVSSSMPKW